MSVADQTVTGMFANDPHASGVQPARRANLPRQPTETLCSNGVRQWQYNGCLHRTDGPAVIFPHGAYCWWLDGQRHRQDGPAVHSNGSAAEQWWVHGKRHRVGGPSTTWADGSTFWHQHGKLHRTDGPAVMNRSRPYEWWVNGQQVLDRHHRLQGLEPDALTIALTLWTPEDDIENVIDLVVGALLVPGRAAPAR
jgi:hypothetical protein